MKIPADRPTRPSTPLAKRASRAPMPNTMTISPAGLAFIRSEEGTILQVYADQAGLPTIGIGHLIAGRSMAEAKALYPFGITLEQAEAMLQTDVRPRVACVNACVNVTLTQAQFDALCDFEFNLGLGALPGSTLLAKLNAGDYQGAADEFPRWDHAVVGGVRRELPVLLARRNAERAMFLAA